MLRLARSIARYLPPVLLAATPASPAAAAVKQPPQPNPAGDSVDLVLGLVRQQGKLRSHVKQISDPSSARYRDHLTVSQIQSRYGANRRTRAAVRRFFSQRGLRARFDATGATATVRMSLTRAEQMFATRVVTSVAGGRQLRRVRRSPTPPPQLRPHVRELNGLDNSNPPRPQTRAGASAINLPTRTGTPAGCPQGLATGAFSPDQIATAHGFAGLHKRNIKGQGRVVALIEFGGGFRQSDMVTWAQCFGRSAANVRAVPVGIPTPLTSDQPASIEVALDIQVLLGMAPGLRRIDVYEGQADASFNQLIAAALDSRVSGDEQLPDVISISYGACEPGVVASDDLSDVRLTRYMLLAAAAAGIPVVISSGDTGSSGCVREQASYTQPATSFPSTLDFATAVGGTSFRLHADNSIADQRVWNDTVWGLPPTEGGGGGGGKSILTSRPYYQPRTNEATGRGARVVPDVAFYADEVPGWILYCTATQGDCARVNGYHRVGGTSAAAPALAAGIALTNQYAARRDVPRLGFVNPILYRIGERRSGALRDVRLGNNDLFGVNCCVAKRGFDAASGWGSARIDDFAREATRAWQDSPAG